MSSFSKVRKNRWGWHLLKVTRVCNLLWHPWHCCCNAFLFQFESCFKEEEESLKWQKNVVFTGRVRAYLTVGELLEAVVKVVRELLSLTLRGCCARPSEAVSSCFIARSAGQIVIQWPPFSTTLYLLNPSPVWIRLTATEKTTTFSVDIKSDHYCSARHNGKYVALHCVEPFCFSRDLKRFQRSNQLPTGLISWHLKGLYVLRHLTTLLSFYNNHHIFLLLVLSPVCLHNK